MTPSSTLANAARQTFLPFALPAIGEDEIAEVVDTLRSGWITTGPKAKRFEAAFADYVGAPARASPSTPAPPGCISRSRRSASARATKSSCQRSPSPPPPSRGASRRRPVLVDVDEDLFIDPGCRRGGDHAEDHGRSCRCTTAARRATSPDLCARRRHGLAVVEDAAHAVGSEYHGRRIGAAFDRRWPQPPKRATVFSFYATKNIATGEGGMLTATTIRSPSGAGGWRCTA